MPHGSQPVRCPRPPRLPHHSCLTLASGDAVCDEGAFGECGDPCASNADCTDPDLPACVVSRADLITNETTTLAFLCGPPVTVGACTAVAACGP